MLLRNGRVSVNPLPSPAMTNPHFSNTRDEWLLSLAARAYNGQVDTRGRNCNSADS